MDEEVPCLCFDAPLSLLQVGFAVTSTAEGGGSDEDEGIGQGKQKPVIGFDMGGTSTDVSRFDGSYEHIFESTTAGVSIRAPQVREKGGACAYCHGNWTATEIMLPW